MCAVPEEVVLQADFEISVGFFVRHLVIVKMMEQAAITRIPMKRYVKSRSLKDPGLQYDNRPHSGMLR